MKVKEDMFKSIFEYFKNKFFAKPEEDSYHQQLKELIIHSLPDNIDSMEKCEKYEQGIELLANKMRPSDMFDYVTRVPVQIRRKNATLIINSVDKYANFLAEQNLKLEAFLRQNCVHKLSMETAIALQDFVNVRGLKTEEYITNGMKLATLIAKDFN